jgi:sugar phosphate isomerase/epimerase
VHIKNSRPLAPGEQRARFLDADSGQRYTGTDLDGGVIDLPPILAELDHLGYDGYMLLEYQGEEDPRAALPRNVAYLRRLLERQ